MHNYRTGEEQICLISFPITYGSSSIKPFQPYTHHCPPFKLLKWADHKAVAIATAVGLTLWGKNMKLRSITSQRGCLTLELVTYY